MNHDVIIYGAGGMAREVYEWSFCNGDKSSIGTIVGYFSDEGITHDFEITTNLSFVDIQTAIASNPRLRVLMCIGDPAARKVAVQKVRSFGAVLHTFVHPSALIARTAQIGAGAVIYPFVVVSSNTKIGESCVINSYTGIGHDVQIGDFCTICAQVDLTGYVKLGDNVFVGSGARVVPKKKIGSHSKISAGVTVIRSLEAHSVVLPSPTKAEK